MMTKRHEKISVIARPYLIMTLALMFSSAFIMFKGGNQMVWASFLSAGIGMSGIAGILYLLSSKIKSESFQSWRIFLSAWFATIIWNLYMMQSNEIQIADYFTFEKGLVLLFDTAFQTPLLFGGVAAGVEWLFNKKKWLVK